MWSLAKYILLSKLLMHLPVGKLPANKDCSKMLHLTAHTAQSSTLFSAPQTE